MNDQEIKRAIDVCRPNMDDPSLPEISGLADVLQHDEAARRLYERTQQCDTVIADAFQNVSVPDGLADRLLAAVGKQTPPASEVAVCSVEDLSDSAEAATRLVSPPKHWHWRHVAIAVGTVAAAAAICLVLFQQRDQDIIRKDALPTQVADWMKQLNQSSWNEDLAHLGLHDYPPDPAIRAPQRWCRVETPYDSQTVVYDLAGPGSAYAVAFCIRAKVGRSQLSTDPTTISTTGGKVIAAWQRSGLVYVVVIKGDLRRYRSFVESAMIIG
jgi:hypothetical protein